MALVRGVMAFSSKAGSIVVGGLFDVHEDRPGAAKADGFGGGHEGVGNGDDFVLGSHSQSQQGKPKGVGAVADAHGVSRAAVGGEFLFKFGDKRAAGKSTGVQDFGNGGIELFADRRMVSVEIKEWYFHGCRMGFRVWLVFGAVPPGVWLSLSVLR